jgi:hypothetical protein
MAVKNKRQTTKLLDWRIRKSGIRQPLIYKRFRRLWGLWLIQKPTQPRMRKRESRFLRYGRLLGEILVIFRSRRCYGKFIELLSSVPKRFGVRLRDYVLMVICRWPEANPSQAIHWLNVSYTVFG